MCFALCFVLVLVLVFGVCVLVFFPSGTLGVPVRSLTAAAAVVDLGLCLGCGLARPRLLFRCYLDVSMFLFFCLETCERWSVTSCAFFFF